MTNKERLEQARVKAGYKAQAAKAATSKVVSLLAEAQLFDLIEEAGAALKSLDSVLEAIGPLPEKPKVVRKRSTKK